jgi:uncharacterized delta-60 repeat protein
VATPLGGAAAGELDRTFNRDGKVVTHFGADDIAEDVAPSDFCDRINGCGRVMVVGWSQGTDTVDVVKRYLANGSLDLSFGTRAATGSATAVAVHDNGKIVVAGRFQLRRRPWGYGFAVWRYDQFGVADSSFGSFSVADAGFGPGGTATGVAVQPDGKIVAVGSADAGGADFAVVRFLPNGMLDPSFGGDGRVMTAFTSARDVPQDVAIQRDGKIVVGGYAGWHSFPAFSPSPDFAVARYNVDGSLDSEFDGDGKATTPIEGDRSFAHDLALQADGKILLAGGPIVRYTADGRADVSFGVRGKVVLADTRVETLALQPDRKILAVGTTEPPPGDFVVTRLRADGRPDTGARGRVLTDFAGSDDSARAAFLQRDGRLVVFGSTTSGGSRGLDFAAARYLGPSPTQCAVPNVRGTTLRVARSRIRAAFCSVGRVKTRSSRRVRKGRVIAQSPRPGARLRLRGPVHLVVAG